MPAVYWLILGLVLITLELFNPGAYLLWIGLGALSLALVAWLGPDVGLVWQVVIFGVLSLAWILAYRQWRRVNPRIEESDHPTLNRRAAQLVGQVHALQEPIVNGRGRIKIGDPFWVIAGPDLPAGQRVRVVSADGMTLIVEPE